MVAHEVSGGYTHWSMQSRYELNEDKTWADLTALFSACDCVHI